MTLKLYTARVEFAYHVAAETQEDARRIAIIKADDALLNELDSNVVDVRLSHTIEHKWQGGYPMTGYKANLDKLTCEQILENNSK